MVRPDTILPGPYFTRQDTRTFQKGGDENLPKSDVIQLAMRRSQSDVVLVRRTWSRFFDISSVGFPKGDPAPRFLFILDGCGVFVFPLLFMVLFSRLLLHFDVFSCVGRLHVREIDI